MRHSKLQRRALRLLLAASALAWPTAAAAQTPTGNAKAARVTTLGVFGGATTVLAGTGSLAGAGDARDATMIQGSMPALLDGETLNAATIGWPDQAVSEASLASLGMSVAGTAIAADYVMARATSGASGGASAQLDNLRIAGVPIEVSGEPNQTIAIPGGQVVLNEQRVSSGSTTVNALHVVVPGVIDVVIASATAGLQ